MCYISGGPVRRLPPGAAAPPSAYFHTTAEDPHPTMAKLDELLKLTRQHEASDLHLTSGSAPYLRVHGDMLKLKYREVSA